MSLYLGNNSVNTKILHITSGEHSESSMKADNLLPDTIWHSESQHATVIAYSQAVITNSGYTTYSFPDLSGTPPSGSLVLTLARSDNNTYFVNFDGLNNIIKPSLWDSGNQFTCLHWSSLPPVEVYRFWIKYDKNSPTDIKVDNTGIYFDNENNLQKKLIIIKEADLPANFAALLNLEYYDIVNGTQRFILTSDIIDSFEMTQDSLTAKNSSGQNLITLDGRELSIMYNETVDMRNGGGLDLPGFAGAVVGKRLQLNITPNIVGQEVQEILLSGDLFSRTHIGAEEIITDDGYGNNASLAVDLAFKVPPVGYQYYIPQIIANIFGADIYVYVYIIRAGTNTFYFDFYHMCTSSARDYCRMHTSGGFKGSITALS